MVFVAEALAGWLVGQVADAGRKRLTEVVLGTDQERAMRQAATAAIQATAQQLRPGSGFTNDPQGAGHLAGVIDQVFQETPTPAASLGDHATLLQGLQAGVAARLAVLGDADITGTGQSSAEVLGVTVPTVIETLTSYLLREILTRGASGGPLTPLSAQLNHDLTHLQGEENRASHEQHSASLARLIADMQSVLAMLRLDPHSRSIPARATQPLGRPVHELTDPFELEVHRAIDAPGGTAPLPLLPTYVKRDHDARLHAIVKQAAEGRSKMTVLVGGSSTGKTRACWEAVQGLPDDWRLWHPIEPSRPEAADTSLPAVGPRTVIWLNEAHRYLLTRASDLGERVAAGLRALLRDPARGPVLVLGTIWPEDWGELTKSPKPGAQDDPHEQARALLIGTDIAVPDAFTGPMLRAVQAAASGDPRLAEAARRAEDGQITQFLAGAPALLERYRNAPPPARALIEAAMDARRLGHGQFLPRSLLEEATPGYLSDQQLNALGEDWLEQALAYCANSSWGPIGPLTPVQLRPGQPALTQPHYRLADYLEQTGLATRRIVLAPAALWEAFVEHANERDLRRLAGEAVKRSLRNYALRLCQRAVQAGDHNAPWMAGRLLMQAGQSDDAIAFYRRAAENGDHQTLRMAAEELEKAGHRDEAIDLYLRAAEKGSRFAMGQGLSLLQEAGRDDQALDWLRTLVAKTGNSLALVQIGGLLQEAGRSDEAIEWYQRAAEAGERYALRWGAELLQRAGRSGEAIDWYQHGAEAGVPDALEEAIKLLREAGRSDEAIAWLQTRAENGDPDALRQATRLLQETGRTNEAIDWLQTRAEAGVPDALRQAATLLQETGRSDEAIAWLQTRAENGDPDALRPAARLLHKAGRIDEAIDWYQRAAENGDGHDLEPAARLLQEAGRSDEAIHWLQTCAENGDRHAFGWAARLLQEAGRSDEAIEWYQRAAEAGDPAALWLPPERLMDRWSMSEITATGDWHALKQATELLQRVDRIDEAVNLLQTHAAETGKYRNLRAAATLLEQTRRSDEAIDWYQRAAEAGDFSAPRQAARLLEQAGRIDEAIDWYERAAEAGDRDAFPYGAPLLVQAGRSSEYLDWYRRAIGTTFRSEGLRLRARSLLQDENVLLQDVTELFRQTGRIDEALDWLQALAAETGNLKALEQAARLLEQAGRSDEAIAWYGRAAEAGDRDALGQAARLLEQVGRSDEAIRLRRDGLVPGSRVVN